MDDQTEISLEAVTIEAEDVIVAIPPRYWWLKRLGIVCVLMMVGLVGLRLYWGWEADRRLQIQLDKFRADGQPVLPSEFDALLDAVPDDENAAILLEKAMNKIVATAKDGTNFEDFRDDPTLFETNMSTAREIIEANEAVFAMVEQALELPNVAWPSSVQSYLMTFLPKLFSLQRQLGKLLWFKAAYGCETSDYVACIKTTHLMLDYGEVVGNHPILLTWLVGIATIGQTNRIIEEYGTRISLKIPHFRHDSTGLADRNHVLRLRDALLNERKVRRNMRTAFRGEGAIQISLADSLVLLAMGGVLATPAPSLSFSRRMTTWIFRPISALEMSEALRYTVALLKATNKPNWPSATATIIEPRQHTSLIGMLSHPYASLLGVTAKPIVNSLRLAYKHLLYRRMAATALAIGLYKADHDQRPEQLEQLVPEYLPAVPLDPFSPSDEAIRYILHDEHPRLYSVGENGADDGGQKTSYEDDKGYTYKSDILFYLDGKPKDKDNN